MRTGFRLLLSQLSLITWIGIATILAVVFMNFHRWKNHDVISYDTIHYYGYLPSAFIYHDLSINYTDQNPEYFSDKIWYNTTGDGHKVFKVGMGMSVCYLPFFLLAHGYCAISGLPMDGFSAPYKVALVWSSFFYGIIGLYFLRKILRIWFHNEVVISVTLLLIIFGTNLFNYVTYNNAMSHAYSFALITAFIWFTARWHNRANFRDGAIIGILAGWIFLIRPVNILVVLIFILWGWNGVLSSIERLRYFALNFRQVLVVLLSGFLMVLPQLIYWKVYTGQWVFYSYTGERFFFAHPYILEGLFSWRKGWLIYTPLMILAFVGIFFIRKQVRELTISYPILFIGILYITFSWWCWWYGGGFGQRSLVDWYGLFALAIAAVLNALSFQKTGRIAVAVFVVLIIGLSQLNHIQYRYGTIHFDSMTRQAYFYNFGRIKKRPGFDEMLKAPNYDAAREGKPEYAKE